MVQRELQLALDVLKEQLEHDIYVVPVRLEECNVPGSLQAYQWVDYFDEAAWLKLRAGITYALQRRAERSSR